jgi:hypothetical protein
VALATAFKKKFSTVLTKVENFLTVNALLLYKAPDPGLFSILS